MDRALVLGPTSCREAEGLGSRSRAWENMPSKLPEQFPPAVEKRGLQGHSRWLNIGTLGGGSGSCLPQGAVQFLLIGAGMRFSRTELRVLSQPVVDSGTWSMSVWIWGQLFAHGCIMAWVTPCIIILLIPLSIRLLFWA